MDFHLMSEARREVEAYLSHLGISTSNEPTRKVMSNYFNLKNKLIDNKKRHVFYADHLEEKAKELFLDHIVEEIKLKFINGEDVNPFLSKGAHKPDDHDLLLNEWGLHHLHLNNKKKKDTDYFNARADFLLFIHIENTDVYFIDIRPHKEENVFAKKELLRVIKNNWKHINDKFLLGDGTIKMTHHLSEDVSFPKTGHK